MYICMYTYAHTNEYVCIYAYTNEFAYIHIHIEMNMHVSCIHVCIYGYNVARCIHIYIYVCNVKCMHAYTDEYAYLYMYAYIYLSIYVTNEYACIQVFIHVHSFVDVCIHVQMNMQLEFKLMGHQPWPCREGKHQSANAKFVDIVMPTLVHKGFVPKLISLSSASTTGIKLINDIEIELL
jgi:hypothetical protein